MSNKILSHTGVPFPQLTIQEAINNIKADYEGSIASSTSVTINKVRSSILIKYIHNAIKSDFVKSNVHPSLINPSKKYLEGLIGPPLKAYNRPRILWDQELQLAGYLKPKYQDVSIIPDNIPIKPSVLRYNTMMKKFKDIYGKLFTESVLTVNVRSQLSSIDKNFDTLYERTFAESLNLHLRNPKMVLGEVYLIPVSEYDEENKKAGVISFNDIDIEKYIKAFQAINSRLSPIDKKYKYERCCLLIVDFNRSVPKIYNTTAELIQDGILNSNTRCTMTGLDYPNFISNIIQIYTSRFPANILI